MSPIAAESAPLTDAMLVMDAADMFRRHPELHADSEVLGKLRALYLLQGIEVSDDILRQGIAAVGDGRFAFVPPKPSPALIAARVYVARKGWLPGLSVVLLVTLLAAAGYLLVWGPFQAAQIEQARVDLAEKLPADMDALYQTIFTETKVQQATAQADAARTRGKAAAAAGNRAGAEAAITELTAIRDTLRREYRLALVDRPGLKWGFWTFPQSNTDETNYYLVVEARAPDGTALRVPVRDDATGLTESVTLWGLRVPETVYRTVAADKADNGSIGSTLIGVKQFGFLVPVYTIEVLGGAVTRW